MNSKAAYTILSQNYFGQALSLEQSFKRHHSDVDFYFVIIDRKTPEKIEVFKELNVIWAEDVGIENYWRHAFKFDVIEWSTNVKPFVAQKLFSQYEKVLYLDPDFYFYQNIDWIYEELSDCSVLVTPHATTPIYDEHPQGDLEWMRVGTFNLGFIGMRNTPETLNFLNWWGQRCLSDGYLETASGVFVDQKWVTLAMGFYPGIKILFNKGINVASWNLHERPLANAMPYPKFQDGSLLYFFHFSGFNYDNPRDFSKRQSRWRAGSHPEYEKLADEYKKVLMQNSFKERISIPYSNDFFLDGVYITPLIRKVYAVLFGQFNTVDPFVRTSDIYQYGIEHSLVGEKILPEKRLIAKDMESYGKHIRVIDMFLKLTLKALGPIRYFNLMRYLSYISSVRQQKGVFKR